jgi:hypothetical protein
VKKGDRDPDYGAAPLCTTLPARIENALIMSMDVDQDNTLKVIRDAATTANNKKVGAWTKDKAAFEKLFSLDYTLGFGEKTTKADIFLTGLVENKGDRKLTTVNIVAFTKENWKDKTFVPFKVATFTVQTDRLLLRDLGYNFVLNSRSLAKRNYTAADLDRDAIEKVYKDEEKGTPDDRAKPIDVGGMRFDIFYDDVKQDIRLLSGDSEGSKSPIYYVNPVKAGTKVTLGLTRITGEGKQLGVVVKVNGVSIYQKDQRDSLQCLKWLFDSSDKGKAYTFTGFQMDPNGDVVYPFQVLTAEQSVAKANELGARAGWIDVDVFAPGDEQVDDEDDLVVSTRGMPRGKGGKPAPKAESLKELQKTLLTMNNVAPGKKLEGRDEGVLIVHSLKPVRGSELKQQRAMPHPIRVGGITIKYYDRSGDNSVAE